MERSLHSRNVGRAHSHARISWQKPGAKSIDHATTDSWAFKNTRPRVDVNSEMRGPRRWLEATQRGHVYCSVHKEGAVYTDTNYPPRQGLWAPEPGWVVSLYKQHKLGHDAHLRLSAKLRGGHDRRMASVGAAEKSEAALAFEAERAWAREQVKLKALAFKPLPPEIELWKMSYGGVEERYEMLVLHGPSRTGKSRLARALFGADRTMVVDVQRADHPDMHGHERHRHLAVLVDEAHVDGAILGQSATQLHTHEVFLWRTPITITTNNWDLSTLTVAEIDWIASNCVSVYIGKPVCAAAKAPPCDRSPSQRRPVAERTPPASPWQKRRHCAGAFASPMSGPIGQGTRRQFWLSAPAGRLSPWGVAKALGLREASEEVHGGQPNMERVAARLTKSGGGAPTRAAAHALFTRIDSDPGWFPGKRSGAKRGPKPLLTAAQRRCVAASAKAAKKRDQEPCVAAAVNACPAATLNPGAGKPFCDKKMRELFTNDCYDFDPEYPWKFQRAMQKVFLPKAVKHDQMRQAFKGSRRYISDDAKMYSPNLLGPPTALKQRQWDGAKVNWFTVLARGVVHVEVMPADWKFNGKGVALFVERLPGILRKMLGAGARLPRHAFTDRGAGMYRQVGKVVNERAEAMEAATMHLYLGRDAARQSPDVGDVLLHETAVAWFRKQMRNEGPNGLPWHETTEQWARRARRVVAAMNQEYDVSGLCASKTSWRGRATASRNKEPRMLINE
ncbi:unnamed protein product [Prorocentrum cordatum]|uniref:Uncharacterized protein n=1 Tax=Prorocentrum cordatum TaxID=2364126 RepID=A0ABN9Q9X7_9DINO|nr:unnamed protein product [Polarella glacialis]